MRIMIYVLSIIVFIILTVFIVGLFLPKQRILTKETVYDASIETVYNSVTNNSDWEYRKSLDSLRIIESKNDFEIWEELSKGLTIRFETKEKRPYTFYSFKMDCIFFKENGLRSLKQWKMAKHVLKQQKK